jgi:purine catabolism regulator
VGDTGPARAEADAAFTIADALALPAMREGTPEVLAGEGQLTRAVRWVHSGEYADMPSVLKGGELLLTHGVNVGSREERQRRYVADLSRAGLAGLVIELGKAMRRVPTPLIDEARGHDLPLIVLHQPIPWIAVTEAIHREIVVHQAALLERGQALQDRLLDLVASGADAAEVLQALAGALGNPVVLSREGEILFTAPREHRHATVAAAWESANRRLPSAPPAISGPVAVAGDPHWATMSVHALERPLHHFEQIALDRALPIVALAFLRAHEEETLAARDRGDFLDALIDDEARLDGNQAQRRASALGFDRRTSWLLPLAADLAPGSGRFDHRRWALIARDIRQELASRQIPAVVGTLSREPVLAIVAGLDTPGRRVALSETTAETIRTAVERTGSDTEVVICSGSLCASWPELGGALRETVDALPAMRHAPAQAWHDVSRADLRRLLWTLREEPAVATFVNQCLEPLRSYDVRHKSELTKTLEIFCAHGGRKTDAAKALHLERQSLYKRLARIEALLGADLTDEDTLLGLHLALRARHVLRDAGLSTPPDGDS